jgi:hypothetical protein
MQYFSPKSQYVSTRMHGVTFNQTRESDTQRGTDCSTLLFAKARRFQDALLSEQTREWFCNVSSPSEGNKTFSELARKLVYGNKGGSSVRYLARRLEPNEVGNGF